MKLPAHNLFLGLVCGISALVAHGVEIDRGTVVALLSQSSARWKQVGALPAEAEGKKLMAESSSLPRISLVSRQFLAQFSGARFGLPISVDQQAISVGTSALEVVQSIYDPTASSKVLAADLYQKYAFAQQRSYQADLIFQALSHYLTAQRARRRFVQTQASLERAQAIQRIATERLKSGAGIKLDTLRADGLVAAEKLRQMEQENNYLKAKEELSALVGGLPPDAEMPALTWQPASLPSKPEDWPKDKPDMEAQRLGLQAAQALEKAVRRESWPKLAFAGEVSAVGAASVLGVGNSNLNWTVGVQLTIPLYDGSFNSGKLAEESSRVLKLETQLAQTTRDSEGQWKSLIRQFATAEQALVVAKAQVAAVNEELRLATQKFQAGSASAIELRNALAAAATALDTESESVFFAEMLKLQACRLKANFSECGVEGRKDG
jgi:outer membrane protein TolC